MPYAETEIGNIYPGNFSKIERENDVQESTNTAEFLELYRAYTENNTEAPRLFHIWCAICGVAATLGKHYYFTRGHFRIYPNLYVMLIGSPGTGKGTSINILQNLLLESGYGTFAADRSSKEKFILDFYDGFTHAEMEPEIFLDQKNGSARHSLSTHDIFASFDLRNSEKEEAKEVFILAEEFNDFIGTNNTEFISLLTMLWSKETPYIHKLKNSRSVIINNPCVNILGGNTSAGFAMAFPAEIIGQGFLARLLPVYGEPTGKRISFPTRPLASLRTSLSERLRHIREVVKGEAAVTEDARILLDRINQQWQPMQDSRFQHYATRRFNQLIKLCLVFSAFDTRTEISADVVRDANTILSHTEELMPKAIGEFGKAKNADVTSKIMEILWQSSKGLTTKQLWMLVSSDLNQYSDLAQILSNLVHAEKVQSQIIAKEQHWLPKNIIKGQPAEFINQELKQGLY
jgi:energy-coupling factor transporter ATP-binding protein EcfA2